MANLPLLRSRQTFLGVGKESTQGTAVAATFYVPYTGFKPDDVPQYVHDDSMANNPTKVRGIYQAELDSTVDLDGYLYPETIGNLLVAAGYADTVTGAGPYVHTFKVPATGVQPPSYTLSHFNNVTTRQYPGAVLDQLDFTIDAKGAIKYVSKWKAWPSVTTSKPTPAFPTSAATLGWENTLSIGGAANGKLQSATISLKANVEVIHTAQGSQNPLNVFSGELEADHKLKLLFVDEVDWTHIRSNDQPALVYTITTPSAGPVLTMTSTTCAWLKAPLELTGKYQAIGAELVSVYNATDGGPMAFVLTNTVAAAY